MVLQRFADERSKWLRHPLPIAPVVVFEILGFPYLEDERFAATQVSGVHGVRFPSDRP